MYIALIIIVSGCIGYGTGVISVLISRNYNNRRKIKKKYSFEQDFEIQKPTSDVSKYNHNREEHSSVNY